MADQISTNTSIQDIPAWMKNFMSSADPNYAGILDEAMRQYQARSGSLDQQQLADLQMPTRQIAGRTPLQQQATSLAQGGVGSYLPMLQAGATSVGSGVAGVNSGVETMQQGYNPLAAAQQMVTDSTAGALPYRDFAINQMQNSIPEVQAAAQAGVDVSALGRQGVISAGQRGEGALQGAARRGELAAAGGVQGITGATNMGVRSGQQTAQNILTAGSPADELGQFGLSAAQSGIAGLGGSAAQFDPSSISEFMNPYEQSVIDATMADISRAGVQQQNQLGSRAAAAGAFGGSRMGVQGAEISRNVLEQQAKASGQLRQAGYQSASQRAQAAYESAKGRQQQGASLISQIGQQGAGTGLQATQVGMGAAQQAGQAQMQGAQMGMQGAQSAGQMGLAGAQAAGQMGAQGAQMGMQGASQGAGLGMQGAQMGMQAAGQTAQLGGQVGSMGQSYGQMGLAGAGQMGAIAGQYGALGSGMANASQGLGSLGMQQAQLGEAQQGLNLNDMNTLSNIGAQEQAQQQSVLGAQYANQYQQYQQPMQELGFYSDVFQGMPIGQSSYSQGSAPGPSAISQVGGLATGLYGMYRATQ